jgi:hypothetical protein
MRNQEEIKMDVKINKAQWDGLHADDRKKIEAIIDSHFKGTKIVGDHQSKTAEDALEDFKFPKFNIKNPLCTAACGVAEAAAVAACAALSGPAIPVCTVAAHAAGSYCRSRC